MLPQSTPTTAVCELCGTSFTSRYSFQRFCSPVCEKRAHNMAVEATCAYCGETFRSSASALKRGRRFCSIVCGRATKVEPAHVVTTCPQCGKVSEAAPSRARKFCSEACAAASHRQRVACTCLTCGAVFDTIPARLAEGHRFCSKACWYRFKASSEKTRFWSQVDTSGECWIWIGRLTADGYGQFTLKPDGTGKKRQRPAHRVAYEWENGPLAADVLACHTCDVRYAPDDISYRRCVRPAHIQPGSATDNNRHTVEARRHRYREP